VNSVFFVLFTVFYFMLGGLSDVLLLYNCCVWSVQTTARGLCYLVHQMTTLMQVISRWFQLA